MKSNTARVPEVQLAYGMILSRGGKRHKEGKKIRINHAAALSV